MSEPTRTGDRAWGRRSLVAGLSVAGHLLALFLLVLPRAEPPALAEPAPMIVQLVELPKPPEPMIPPAPAPPAPVAAPPTPDPPKAAKSPPPRTAFRKTAAAPDPLPASTSPAIGTGDEVSDAQMAGAATAGSGGSGGGCDMLRAVQAALRKDALVRAAVFDAHRGRPIMVWNGDWVRHSDQEGNGLAAVREAIMWEVGFAPAECKHQTVHGLVAISLHDGPGAPRIVVGSGTWRWSDLLFAHATGRSTLSMQ
jgi:hypothetical protein